MTLKLNEFQRRIRKLANGLGVSQAWMHHYVASIVLASMLGRAKDDAGHPLFLAKGGPACAHPSVSGAIDVL